MSYNQSGLVLRQKKILPEFLMSFLGSLRSSFLRFFA
jgi:hypothetical protein